jgi:hypothetical protein
VMYRGTVASLPHYHWESPINTRRNPGSSIRECHVSYIAMNAYRRAVAETG